MGKRLRVQKRGRGASQYRAHTHRRIAPASLLPVTEGRKMGVVEELMHERGRGSPLAKIRMGDGSLFYNVVPEGLYVNKDVEIGKGASVETGNVLPLSEIPPGIMVCNLELQPGDGGKLARSSGAFVTVVSHTAGRVEVRLPSGKSRYVDEDCKAMIGVVSGGGRTDKPFMKAGIKVKWMRSRGRLYPMSKGIAMNPYSHPHGGGSHKSQSLKPTSVSRQAPPGQKVGLIAPRRAGHGSRKR